MSSNVSTSVDAAQKAEVISGAVPSVQIDDDNESDVESSHSSIRSQRVKQKNISKEERKQARKAAKAAAREKRNADPKDERKLCDLCHQPQVMLYRCRIDVSAAWRMVCPACWPRVSGGVVDGNPATHPYYRYGGTWKLFKR